MSVDRKNAHSGYSGHHTCFTQPHMCVTFLDCDKSIVHVTRDIFWGQLVSVDRRNAHSGYSGHHTCFTQPHMCVTSLDCDKSIVHVHSHKTSFGDSQCQWTGEMHTVDR